MADRGGLLDKGLQKLDDGWEETKKVVGQGVDKATDGIGAGLEYVGADDWADTPHGVVFLDGQTGKPATLETHNISEIAHVPYR
ncbi:putative T7SS-secreted protein [Streptomyces sp. NRRL S-237]|uniref:putative T7SS-secreted protein n=1 Tax=Streptomyces sp. NRRL S-237 TaxID=1463895 RepID=UPI0004CC2D99|nr:hypothetical protein [Streptomyces sp. NRRL S-237]